MFCCDPDENHSEHTAIPFAKFISAFTIRKCRCDDGIDQNYYKIMRHEPEGSVQIVKTREGNVESVAVKQLADAFEPSQPVNIIRKKRDSSAQYAHQSNECYPLDPDNAQTLTGPDDVSPVKTCSPA